MFSILYNMATYFLPNDFATGAEAPAVFQYSYKSHQESHRSQVQLSHHLLSFLQTGNKTVFLPQQAVTVPDNHFLLLSEGHCLMTETLSTTHTYHSQLLFFKQGIVEALLARHKILLPSKMTAPNVQVLPYDAFVRHFVRSLALVPTAAPLFLQHKVEEFLLYGYHTYGTSFFSFLKTPPLPAAQQLAQVAQQAIYQKLTVEQMAFLCAMSSSTFKRRFAAQYACTPQAWLREQRLQRAVQLLRQGQHRPSELATVLGFQHHSSFTAAFKSRFGRTPSAYLRQQRTNGLTF